MRQMDRETDRWMDGKTEKERQSDRHRSHLQIMSVFLTSNICYTCILSLVVFAGICQVSLVLELILLKPHTIHRTERQTLTENTPHTSLDTWGNIAVCCAKFSAH